MYKKSIVHYIAKYLIDVLLVLSAVCTVVVPIYSGPFLTFIGYGRWSPVILLASGIVCTYILFILRQMYKSLLVGNPFTDKNVSYLRNMAVACAIMTVIWIAKLFLSFTYATVVIAAIFVVGCMFCLTLKDLFKQAINYKAENDLTI